MKLQIKCKDYFDPKNVKKRKAVQEEIARLKKEEEDRLKRIKQRAEEEKRRIEQNKVRAEREKENYERERINRERNKQKQKENTIWMVVGIVAVLGVIGICVAVKVCRKSEDHEVPTIPAEPAARPRPTQASTSYPRQPAATAYSADSESATPLREDFRPKCLRTPTGGASASAGATANPSRSAASSDGFSGGFLRPSAPAAAHDAASAPPPSYDEALASAPPANGDSVV